MLLWSTPTPTRSAWLRTAVVAKSADTARPLDIFWFPAVYSWFPVRRGVPTIVTFHDAIAEHFTQLVLPQLRGRLLWNLKVWLAKRSARHIATVSETAREEIIRYLHIPSEKISVIFEAANARFAPVNDAGERRAAREQLGLPADKRLILYVGGLAPHKNLAGLVEGFTKAIADERLRDVDLILAGDPKGDGFHSNVEELHSLVQARSLEGRVHFPGFDADRVVETVFAPPNIRLAAVGVAHRFNELPVDTSSQLDRNDLPLTRLER